MTARSDITPAYVNYRDLAALLGRSVQWFKDNRAALEREGFPKKDGLIGLTLLWDVEAWIARRRVVADDVQVQQPTSGETERNQRRGERQRSGHDFQDHD